MSYNVPIPVPPGAERFSGAYPEGINPVLGRGLRLVANIARNYGLPANASFRDLEPVIVFLLKKGELDYGYYLDAVALIFGKPVNMIRVMSQVNVILAQGGNHQQKFQKLLDLYAETMQY